MSATLEKHWENAIQFQANRLAGTKYCKVVNQINYESFQGWLESENETYSGRFLSRHVRRLGPILEEFGVFVRSITTMVQGGDSIACIVWGSILAALDAASKYADLMDEITSMIEDMSLLVPQLASYSTLFPGRNVLDACIQTLIDDYVAFCVEAVIFFKRLPFCGGGMGKTQLAIEYTYEYRDHFDYIVWISAETESEIANGMAALASRLQMGLDRDGNDRASMEAARTWLESTANLVSRAVGGLPLAIVHVAGYIRQSQMSLEEFLTLLQNRQQAARIFNEDTIVFQYDKSLRVVHDIALQQLNPQSLKLAQVLSMLSPDGIPKEILSAEHDNPALKFLRTDGDLGVHEMIRSLRARHLIDIQGSGNHQQLLLHRNLQLNLLQNLDEKPSELQSVFDAVVSLTRRMFPRQSPVQFPQNNLWDKCKTYSVQAMSIMNVHTTSDRPPECSIDYALLLSDVSNYFWERNLFGDALRASDAAEHACERFLGTHEVIGADIHTISGAVRDTYGISERSKTLYHYEMAVALRQEHLNKSNAADMTIEDLWNYANAWGNMTSILMDYECYEVVILYADLALKIKRRLLGSGRESVIACYEQHRNKHIALAALGDFEEAGKWEADPENCIDDPTYAAIMIRYHFFHANISMLGERLEEADATLHKVLDMRTELFGPSGRSTLDTYYMLAMVELARRNHEAAEIYLRKALQRPEEWTDEALARAKYRLARIHLLKKEDKDAQILLKEASKVRANCWEKYAKYWPTNIPLPDEDAMYDHIVPAEAGRSTMTRLLPSGTMTTKLNEVCRELQRRLGSSEVQLTTQKLAKTLRTKFSIPVRNQVLDSPF
ncbi:hypothetical protein DL770_006338 [Monosporascus sp. CRB-9-2]|nr:hypothetical protein DL770_006338 [Monosporascus sp. CRB-9-2]